LCQDPTPENNKVLSGLIKRYKVLCEKCTKDIGTSSVPIPEGIELLCLTCSQQNFEIQRNRELHDLAPKYLCGACKDFTSENATDVMAHVMDKHPEVPLGSIRQTIVTIQ